MPSVLASSTAEVRRHQKDKIEVALGIDHTGAPRRCQKHFRHMLAAGVYIEVEKFSLAQQVDIKSCAGGFGNGDVKNPFDIQLLIALI